MQNKNKTDRKKKEIFQYTWNQKQCPVATEGEELNKIQSELNTKEECMRESESE